MRLTLRTLLAYLEDGLPAEDAKRIGRMIARSAGARRVVRRVRKVVRRRRLIAVKPDSDSRRGMDANDMAEYLDNVLAEDKIDRVERRCLKHDALLAEAAACHQILSRVLGEAPTFNVEARRKAYAAVGVISEAPTNTPVVGSKTSGAESTASTNGHASVSDLPIPTFALPESRAGRAALVSLVALLFVALGVVLWRGLEPASIIVADAKKEAVAQPAGGSEAAPAAAANPAKAMTDSAKEIAVVVDRNKTPQLVVAAAPTPTPTASAPTPVTTNNDAATKATSDVDRRKPPPPPKPEAKRDENNTRVPNPTAVKAAEYTSPNGVLCRLKATGPERLQTGGAIMTGDVLANLDGSRSRLSIGPNKLDLVDAAKLKVRAGPEPTFEPQRGRFVFLSMEKGVFRLGVGPDDVVINFGQPNSVVTLEYLPQAIVGGTETPAAILVNAVSQDIQLEQRERKLSLARGSLVDVAVGRGFGTPRPENAPVWLTGSQLSAADLKAADKLSEHNAIPFGTQGVAAALQGRVGDRVRDVRRMALRALAALEVYPAVVEALGDVRFPDNRAAAVSLLRSVVLTDPAGTAAIRQALLQSLPAAEADLVLRLLRGYSKQEFANGAVSRQLLESLDSESLIIRELAIRDLRELTGRDFGYSATEPAARRASAIKQVESYLRERR